VDSAVGAVARPLDVPPTRWTSESNRGRRAGVGGLAGGALLPAAAPRRDRADGRRAGLVFERGGRRIRNRITIKITSLALRVAVIAQLLFVAVVVAQGWMGPLGVSETSFLLKLVTGMPNGWLLY
jgi:hypothetical protein